MLKETGRIVEGYNQNDGTRDKRGSFYAAVVSEEHGHRCMHQRLDQTKVERY